MKYIYRILFLVVVLLTIILTVPYFFIIIPSLLPVIIICFIQTCIRYVIDGHIEDSWFNKFTAEEYIDFIPKYTILKLSDWLEEKGK